MTNAPGLCHALLDSHATVIVAVSGGSDSVALLRLLHSQCRGRLIVAHVHHHLRPEAADGDAAFVSALADALGLPCEIAHIDPAAERHRTGESIEMCARRLRYDALRGIATAHAATAIATGHTLDDQIETFFLRLSRGAGPAGLGGIPAERTLDGQGSGVRGQGSVVGDTVRLLRPLLELRHGELQDYLRSLGQPWREDDSNRAPASLRTPVRAPPPPPLFDTFGETGLR
ncbi:MAG: tRNA lysidine(34) synthetase TilS, partial [Kiritimatiellaeota bacterium]|nr:tRNA lysidine(34) synthetase TilS [Kiritimatiellota bacterium]